MSFKHICSVLKHFYELCESLERAARAGEKRYDPNFHEAVEVSTDSQRVQEEIDGN